MAIHFGSLPSKCPKFSQYGSKFEAPAKSRRPPDRYRGIADDRPPVIQKHTSKIAAVLDLVAPGDFIEIDLHF
jgi:hypothetical protein